MARNAKIHLMMVRDDCVCPLSCLIGINGLPTARLREIGDVDGGRKGGLKEPIWREIRSKRNPRVREWRNSLANQGQRPSLTRGIDGLG